MQLVITLKDVGEVELGTPAMVDFVWLERQFGVSAATVESDPRMEYMLFLAWAALRRKGVYTARYDDEFLLLVENFEDKDADKDEAAEAPDPTGASAAQPTG